MRSSASVLHLDLDAFFASVEVLHKPSLRGLPVIVGGLGGRGVVSTCSYEARVFGVASAMSMREARSRCPDAVVLTPRFAAYRALSGIVMGVLAEISPVIEPLSLDEAFVDLAVPAPTLPDLSSAAASLGVDDPLVSALVGGSLDPYLAATWLRGEIRARSGCTASVGVGSSRLVAKIASDACKPDGLLVVAPGEEEEFLAPRPVRDIPGVGPATTERLAAWGIRTCAQLAATDPELLRALGSVGVGLPLLARGIDPRPITPDRDSVSIGAEETFATDLTTPAEHVAELRRLAWRVTERLRADGLGARTLTVKLRDADFTTRTRSVTRAAPTDEFASVLADVERALAHLAPGRVRLLGVSASGLTPWAQLSLPQEGPPPEPPPPPPPTSALERMHPGVDVTHPVYGEGWVVAVVGSEVRVRFESARTPPASPARDRIFDTSLGVLRVLPAPSVLTPTCSVGG